MSFFTVPVLMIIIGSLIYLLFTRPVPQPPSGQASWWHPQVAELGRICAAAGLFALAFQYISRVVL